MISIVAITRVSNYTLWKFGRGSRVEGVGMYAPTYQSRTRSLYSAITVTKNMRQFVSIGLGPQYNYNNNQ